MRNSRNIGLTYTRILLSLVIIKDLLIYLLSYKSLFGSSSIVPIEIYDSILKLYNLSVFRYLFTTDASTLSVLLIALLLATVLMMGFFNKLSGTLLFLLLLLLKFRNIYIMDGGDNLILVLLPFIAFGKSTPLVTPNNRNFFNTPSIYKIINVELSFLMPIAIIVQVCLVYFFAGLYKLMGPLWQNGTAIFYVMRVDDFRWTSLNFFLTDQYLFVKSLTYFTIIWELSFPFLIIKRKIKNITIAISVLMHIGIFIFMHIDNYSFVMIISYFVFFTDREYARIRSYYKLKFSNKGSSVNIPHLPTIIFFDGDCNLCNGFIVFFLNADKKKIIKFSSLQNPMLYLIYSVFLAVHGVY